MNDITFQSWISIVGPLAAMMYALYRKTERNDERWLATETKILAIMNRLEMRYTDPNAPKMESTEK